MSTLDAKPIKVRILNPKLLPISAVILIVLALLFMAMPLLGSTRGFQRRGNLNFPVNGQSLPGGQNGFPGQGSVPQGQDFPGQSGSNLPSRTFGRPGGGLPIFGQLGGMTGIILYAVAFLASLAAAAGMILKKRWGQVLGIVMGVLYLGMALVSLLPIILLSFMQVSNGLNLSLGLLRVVLAIAVIVLAVIPARKKVVMTTPVLPPEASG
jgi:hypothetical protein